MPDVFISYSSKDGDLARRLAEYLKQHELEVFLAELSLQPGEKWKDGIVAAFREAKWVFFLATPASCTSQPVMHELGGAIMMEKNLVSLMHGVQPKELPEWVRDRQAIDLSERDRITQFIQSVAEVVKSDKFIAGLVAGGLLAFGAYLLMKNSK
jgi:hypothetical protein